MDTTSSGTKPARMIAAFGLVVIASLILLDADPAHAATFTVNRTGDAPDANLNNVACDSNASQAGNQCTLRAAIQEANDTAGADTINFNIGGNASVKTISPASPLPTITGPVTINGYTQTGASPNTLANGNNAVLKVQLNGTNAGAGANGLTIEAANTTIKGLVINRFDGNGILLTGSGATGNRAEGNFIGTNAAGAADLGNADEGVEILRADDNTVGGTAAAARNVISGNGGNGVQIAASNADNNQILGNFIGTDVGGTADLGNANDGVQIFNAPDNTVGGTAAGAGNRIAHNDGDGVFAFFAASLGNRILSNQIFSNGELGIDFAPGDGVTANDTDDPDTGPNNLQNFPVIASAIRLSNGVTIISGTLNSNPNQDFIVQCFIAAPDPSAHGEGQLLVAQATATTDAGGDDGFTCVSPIPQPGQAVTATATNTATGDTSEFSRIVGVVSGP